MLLTDEYFQYHKKYSEIYGKNILILMQVGSFYESYSIDVNLGQPDLLEISKILGVVRVQRNKNKPISSSNPFMLGIPTVSLIKFLEILLENDYVVIIIDQVHSEDKNVDNKKKKETRKVTNIYSKGTYIENLNKKDGNFIVCLFISNDKQKDNSSLLSIGLSAVDILTKQVYIHEIYSTKYDQSYALDEADRVITSLNPKEIMIYYQNNIKNTENFKDFVFNYLKLENNCRYNDKIDQKYFKSIFQNEILKKVYIASKSFISIIEQFDLNKNIYTLVSLSLLFDFIYDKNPNLLINLQKPEHFTNAKHLILGNNTIRQLDILENYNNNSKCKFRSLFHVINQTSTALGERYLKSRILSPLISAKELNITYDYIEVFIKDNLINSVEKLLDNIKDIEKLQRKIELNILSPFELTILLSSYENIFKLIDLIKTNKKLSKLLPNDDILTKIKELIKYINKIFNLKELVKYNSFDISTSIFNDKIHEDIDKLLNSVSLENNFIEHLRQELNKLISPKKCISIKKHNKDGHYLSLTNLKANILKQKFQNNKKIIINKHTIEFESLVFKEIGKNTKIYFPTLTSKSDNINSCNDQMEFLNKKYFLEELFTINKTFIDVFKQCNIFIAKIDFIKSGAKIAKLYNYTRPIIVENDKENNNDKESSQDSFVDIKQLRHPIIERLIDYEYVPHDIVLGKNDTKGILLYGLNSSGKSSLMKAIGLSVIMAQSGLFVPATQMTLCPYQLLYTRITSDDNIFRGLSSFSLEMVEINAILKRSNNKTLIIGDEVCRGTEHISGNAIVSSTIIKLSEFQSSFVFATHLHEIMTLKQIKEIKSIRAFHLHVHYDEKTKTLIYDRKLTEGTGEKIYGITVARYIIQDVEFIDTAMKIKNELLESYDTMISGKTSKYNTNIYVYECHLCGKKDKNSHLSHLETHHINFQKNCLANGFVDNKNHLKKNQEANLIVLCNDCHDKIHAGKVKINGYVMTSKGKNIIIE